MKKTFLYGKEQTGNDEIVAIMHDDVIKVEFINIGEGYNGDYNPEDLEDAELLRFAVYIQRDCSDDELDEDDGWVEVEDSSYCTCIQADTDKDKIYKAINVIFDEYKNHVTHIRNDGSVKKLGESLSWINV